MDKVIGKIKKGRSREIRVCTTIYKGSYCVDLRNYFLKGGEWYPSKKGIKVTSDNAATLSRLIKEALESIANDKLQDALNDDR